MILYMFQCHSPKSSHPLPLPLSQSPKDCSIHQCLFCCLSPYNLSIHPSINLFFIHLSICPFTHIYVSVYLSILHLSFSTRSYTHVFIYLFIHQSINTYLFINIIYLLIISIIFLFLYLAILTCMYKLYLSLFYLSSIGLLSHASKVMLKILQARLREVVGDSPP